jgi:carbon dioxide concentrating mechanism protein CcmN
MHLPSVRPIDFLDIYISGDVTIDESAVIAPGTIIKAAPDSRIVIGAGVCLGMGTVLNASGGAIAVEEGATLGAGVLLVGQTKIGKNACIGAATTIFNASVDPMAVIPAGSLLGDTSRQEIKDPDPVMNQSHNTATGKKLSHKTILDPWEESNQSVNGLSAFKSEEREIPTTETEVQIKSDRSDSQLNNKSSKSPVVGQMYINQLLVTLFPERNAILPTKKDSD